MYEGSSCYICGGFLGTADIDGLCISCKSKRGEIIKDRNNFIPFYKTADKNPHKCPVCNGKGAVPCNFYMGTQTTNAGDIPCRACGGSGVLWG